MDPIISQLNEVIKNRVSQMPTTAPISQPRESSFQSTFDNKLADKLMDKIGANAGMGPKENITVLDVENIHLKNGNVEVAGAPENNKETGMALLKDMNRDLVNLDSTLELMANSEHRLSPQQLLSFQGGIMSMTIKAELLSRCVDGVTRGMQTVVNTQVG